jgi:hypothetical protein
MKQITKKDIINRRDIFEAYMPEQVCDPQLVSVRLLREILNDIMDDEVVVAVGAERFLFIPKHTLQKAFEVVLDG